MPWRFGTLSYIFITPLMKIEQSISKRQYVKFRPRGITQKKECNNYWDIYNTFSSLFHSLWGGVGGGGGRWKGSIFLTDSSMFKWCFFLRVDCFFFYFLVITITSNDLGMFIRVSTRHTCTAHKNFGLYLPLPASYWRHAESQLMFVWVYSTALSHWCYSHPSARLVQDHVPTIQGLEHIRIVAGRAFLVTSLKKITHTHMPYHCRTKSTVGHEAYFACPLELLCSIEPWLDGGYTSNSHTGLEDLNRKG